MRIAVLFILLVWFGLVSFLKSPKNAGLIAPETLSSFGFFQGDIWLLNPAKEVIPYDLNTPLFSNYAEKARFIKLPAGQKASYQQDVDFDLPVGTYLIKSFYYPNDFRDASKGRKLLETRVMYLDETGWQTWPYIWNENQTEATYDPTGETIAVRYTNQDGKKVSTSYLVPNKNQCKGCHIQNKDITPIGIAARHLNKSFNYASGIDNQLQYWKNHDMLADLPAENIPANAKWNDENSPVEDRARAYLDINCGHCHHPLGPASTSGLFLHAQETNVTMLGVLKTPVAAGRGSGNRPFDIVPGKPDQSILLYRMQTNDPGMSMPEIGREQVHQEGVELIKKWIRNMKSFS